MKKFSMKMFDESKIHGKDEEDLRKNMKAFYKEKSEYDLLQENIKTSKFNRNYGIIAIIIAIASLLLTFYFNLKSK